MCIIYKCSMLKQKKHVKFLESMKKHSDEWTRTNKYLLSERQGTNDFIMYKNTLITIYQLNLLHKLKNQFVIAEFQQLVKRATWKGKSSTSENSSRYMKSLQISVLGLISKGRDCKPFWNTRIKESSKKLWLPTKTDSVVLDSISSNGYSNHKAMQESWYSTKVISRKNKNLLKTSYKSSTSLVPEVVGVEVTRIRNKRAKKIKTPQKTLQIRLYPTPQQRKVLKNLIGGYRYVYNQMVSWMRNNPPSFEYVLDNSGTFILFDGEFIKVKIGTHKKVYDFPDPRVMRVIISKVFIHNEWFYKLPNHLVNEAVTEACNNLKKGILGGKKFFLRFKSKRRNVTETFNMDNASFSKNKNAFFSTSFPKHQRNFKCSKQFKELPKYGSSVTYHRVLHSWTLNFTIDAPTQKAISFEKCSLDPGVNIFMTSYSPSEVIQFGTDASDYLTRKCHYLDKLQSRMTKATHSNRQKLRKRFHRQIKRIKDARNELHWKTIDYLTKHYNTIALPDFRTQKMVQKLGRSTSRNMNTLSFFQFKQKMEFKCRERGVKLLIVNEHYTSKTCTRCGNVKKSLNRTKLDRDYKCKECNLIINSDISAARNIYLKTFS